MIRNDDKFYGCHPEQHIAIIVLLGHANFIPAQNLQTPKKKIMLKQNFTSKLK